MAAWPPVWFVAMEESRACSVAAFARTWSGWIINAKVRFGNALLLVAEIGVLSSLSSQSTGPRPQESVLASACDRGGSRDKRRQSVSAAPGAQVGRSHGGGRATAAGNTAGRTGCRRTEARSFAPRRAIVELAESVSEFFRHLLRRFRTYAVVGLARGGAATRRASLRQTVFLTPT